jgi:hypothetical protein
MRKKMPNPSHANVGAKATSSSDETEVEAVVDSSRVLSSSLDVGMKTGTKTGWLLCVQESLDSRFLVDVSDLERVVDAVVDGLELVGQLVVLLLVDGALEVLGVAGLENVFCGVLDGPGE